MKIATDSLPLLHAGHPIWYRGQLAGVAANGEVFSCGWVEARERKVIRALAIAALEAPHLSPEQQLGFAAYYLLPDERWIDLQHLSNDLIAVTTSLPVDLILCRRSLPDLGLMTTSALAEAACA